VRIDHDYIGHVRVESVGRGAVREAEFHNLDFGLALPKDDEPKIDKPEPSSISLKRSRYESNGSARIVGGPSSIALRPNIVFLEDGKPCGRESIAGDHAYELWPEMFRRDRLEATPRQLDEHMYYVPCSICRRTLFQIEQEGLLLTCDPKVCGRRPDRSNYVWGADVPPIS
jgi:molecular chaperone DnaK